MKGLFLTAEPESKDAYKKLALDTASAIADAFTDGRAYSGATPDELKKIIRQNSILPAHGRGFDEVLHLTKEKILPNLLRTPSADYMAHLHSPALLETLAAEMIISALNQSMDSWDQSPAATETEVEVIRHLCALYGYGPDADGVFTSGGSQSNQTAIILGRDWFCNKALRHDVKKFGLPENFSKLRLYTSEISHFSMEKSAHVLGLGYRAVVKVPVDSRKKMDASALRSLIQADKEAGNIPFLIVATVGTTDFGSIDPLQDMAQIAHENGMWLHADAAYGSGVILSEKYRDRLGGIAQCDSITVDFHKMFMMPISCGAVLVRNGADFDALTLHADYLNREEDEEDGYTNLVDKSLQTTRRFDALKVWMSFQTRGADGWSRLIETSMDNARYLYERLSLDADFETVCEPEISSVVFRYTGGTDGSTVLAAERADAVNKRVRRELMHRHGIVIGQTASGARTFLKFTLLNPLITHERLDRLLSLIKTLAKSA